MSVPMKRINGVSCDPGSSIEVAAWEKFYEEMFGKLYGEEETRDAWLWFLAGWHAHIEGPRG